MWELDNKKGCTPKNWCFWTVVWERALESPFNNKEIKVNPKGNQPWIFIGRTEVEAPIGLYWGTEQQQQIRCGSDKTQAGVVSG